MRPFFLPALSAVLLLGCATRTPRQELPATIPPVRGETRTAYALQHIDVAMGTGAAVEPRKCLYAHYTGWLTDGTKFDSSRDTTATGEPRQPISFPQGFRRVIVGWDTGFDGMRVGARRRLIIPYQLAYGEQGRPPVIPPKATLIFDVELMAVADTLPRLEPAAPAPRCPDYAEVAARPAS